MGGRPSIFRPPPDVSMIFTVKLVMTLATLCFAIGYAARRRDNRMHRRVMFVGFLLTVSIAVILAVGVNVFGASYRPAYWLVRGAGGPERAHWVLIAHRMIAAAALIVLGAQVVSGLRRDPLHLRLYPYAIALWLIAYISGMFIFA
jgi:uncharacterized membrane protein YozB (DUF420 family)